ncbi:MAG: alpha-galactosidase [Candidatus Aminicenantales bacterium]|jgi:hypothetical protein
MKRTAFSTLFLAACLTFSCRSPQARDAARPQPKASSDWLISPESFKAEVKADDGSGTIHLSNGLLRRTFRLNPNAATVDFRNLVTGQAILRAVRPEAVVAIGGKSWVVGGLDGQVEQAYLVPGMLERMTASPAAFRFRDYQTGPIRERFPWKRKRYSENRPWPPDGITLTLNFTPPPGAPPGLVIGVVYELYDGIPLLAKRVVIRNEGPSTVRLNSFISEMLAAVEPESPVNSPPFWDWPGLHVESDYAFLADSPKTAARTTYWASDGGYTSQVNDKLETPCLLLSKPPIGPDQDIAPGAVFETFTTWELALDSTDRERRGLSLRRMYRTIAPWATENPIIMHLVSSDPNVIRAVVDQCAETGFEMVILSFGSGLDMENEDPAYLAKMKDAADYAHTRNIEIGGYSLLASRRIDDATDVIDPKTGKPGGAAFGNSPCLGSEWGQDYFRKMRGFFEKTGFDMLEHDGSYPGDLCASTKHPGHRGLEDSQWNQWRRITDFYKWGRARGIYLNVPDWYFLSGSNKTAMGYREDNWSLARENQVVLARQNIYDGTWQKTPSMGWMFVPLNVYHGGGDAATIEPLAEHLQFYEAHLAQNFLSGVQACYRGTRLYDTETTKAAVKKWIDLYKKYRDILDSDIIHLRRPDGRSPDGILHVNPALRTKAFAVIYNQTNQDVSENWTLPLYYTGLTDGARIREGEGPTKEYHLDRSFRVQVPVRLGPGQMTWFIVE